MAVSLRPDAGLSIVDYVGVDTPAIARAMLPAVERVALELRAIMGVTPP